MSWHAHIENNDLILNMVFWKIWNCCIICILWILVIIGMCMTFTHDCLLRFVRRPLATTVSKYPHMYKNQHIKKHSCILRFVLIDILFNSPQYCLNVLYIDFYSRRYYNLQLSKMTFSD